jgi:hypothetical protein
VRLHAQLGDKLGGDIHIIRPGAVSHDIGSILGGRGGSNGEGHHVTGARVIVPILESIGYPLLDIVQIQYCILVHRGSLDIVRKTPEARYIATADGWDHLCNMEELWCVGQRDLGMSPEDTYKWLLRKLENDRRKIMSEAWEIISPDYERAQQTLERFCTSIEAG